MQESQLETKETSNINEKKIYHIKQAEYKPRRAYSFFKRAFDLIFAILALSVLLVPMLIIAVIICIDSPGNPLYFQERLGKGQKKFTMIKFRSMRKDAEKDGPCWAETNDDRCTSFGRIMRKTRIDELPQLWNIITGDMSFVGPRPEREHFYDEFEKTIPNFRDRLIVKPGLTGWAQINGGYDLTPEEKLTYDLEYIKNAGMYMDIKCIFKTVKLVFTGEGAR